MTPLPRAGYLATCALDRSSPCLPLPVSRRSPLALCPGAFGRPPRLRWVSVGGNVSDSVYFVHAASLERRAALAVGHRPYTAVAASAHLYVSNWGDSTVSVIDLSDRPAVRLSLFVGPHPSALALSGSALFAALAGANGVARVDLTTGEVREQ